MANTIDLIKDACLLNGGERARLIIKDTHQKAFGDRKGFLSPAERETLLCMPDHQVKEEYRAYWDSYERMPLTMANITEAYLRFKYYFEALKKAHLLLNVSPAVSYLSQLIEENIANENAKRDAIRVVDEIQVLKTDSTGKPAFKEALSFIKAIVPKTSGEARRFILMKKTVDKTNDIMGFNIFINEHYSESCQVFAEEISLCIQEHNRIMKKFGEGMADLDSYLISESIPESDCDEQ